MSVPRQEAAIFADRDLARRLEGAEGASNAALVEARARIRPDLAAQWIDVDGALAMFDGPDSPVTQTFNLGLSGPVTDQQLDRIERFYVDRGAPVYHEVSPLAAGAMSALTARGYRPVELSSVLYLPLEPDGGPASHSSRLDVRPITVTDSPLWTDVVVRGWSHLPGLAPFLRELGEIALERAHATSYLAWLDGTPVAGGVLCVHGGVAVLAGACTAPEARGRGAQLALLARRLRDARAQGCDLAMLSAEPGSASQRNAERHGFRIAYTRIKWTRAT